VTMPRRTPAYTRKTTVQRQCYEAGAPRVLMRGSVDQETATKVRALASARNVSIATIITESIENKFMGSKL
jgi:hypothetical protein